MTKNIENLVFADDLFAFTIDQSIKRIVIKMQRYLQALETWLSKWRLIMAAHKCYFSVYLGNVPVLICKNSLQLIMHSEPVPFDDHLKYLGVHLDRRLTFNNAIINNS